MASSRGLLYIASGEEFFEEAVTSARSAWHVMPNVNITIVTDQTDMPDCFDDLILMENPTYDYLDKIRYMRDSPYERTLFVDSDTYFSESVEELFEILDTFHLAASHAPARSTGDIGVCEAFSEYNTGVLLYRYSDAVMELFSEWERLYDDSPDDWTDQPAFRKALFESGLPHYILTPEYNCRTWASGYLNGPAKIIHGRHSNLSQVAEKVNSTTQPRAYRYRFASIEVYPYLGKNGTIRSLNEVYFLFKHAKNYYRKKGLSATVIKAVEHLADRLRNI